MAKLTIIVGPGGSGKSTYGRMLNQKDGVFFSEDATLVSMADNGQRAGFGKITEAVARMLGNGEDCIIEESHLLDPVFRNLFVKFCDERLPGVDRHWVFFEHSPLGCINNVYHDAYSEQERVERNHDSRFEAVLNQIKNYQVPEPAELAGDAMEIQPVSCTTKHFSRLNEAKTWLENEVSQLKRAANMQSVGVATVEEIEQHLKNLGGRNHEDNMARVFEGEHRYKIGLSLSEFESLTFVQIEATVKISPQGRDRRLIEVAKRANALSKENRILGGNWNLDELYENTLNQLALGKPWPDLLLIDPRCDDESRWGAEGEDAWRVQDGNHRALGYMMALLRNETKFIGQHAYVASRNPIRFE